MFFIITIFVMLFDIIIVPALHNPSGFKTIVMMATALKGQQLKARFSQ
jgi:hypothetical protein